MKDGGSQKLTAFISFDKVPSAMKSLQQVLRQAGTELPLGSCWKPHQRYVPTRPLGGDLEWYIPKVCLFPSSLSEAKELYFDKMYSGTKQLSIPAHKNLIFLGFCCEESSYSFLFYVNYCTYKVYVVGNWKQWTFFIFFN